MRILLFFIFLTFTTGGVSTPFNFLYAQTNDLLFEDLAREFKELDVDYEGEGRGLDSVDEETEEFDDVQEESEDFEDIEDTEDRSIDSVEEEDEVGEALEPDDTQDEVAETEDDYFDDVEEVADSDNLYEEEIEDEVRDLANDEELTSEPSYEVYDTEDRSIDSVEEETYEVELSDDGEEYDSEAYDVEDGYEGDPYNEEDVAYDEYEDDAFVDESLSEENVIDNIVSESILEDETRNIASEEEVEGSYEEDMAYEDEEYREVASDGLNSPDLELETYLDDIFSRYSDRLDQSRWEEMIGNEKVKEIYPIQPGDTLWDISTTLFGSGYFWPKIWQINSVILNPHFILSGGQIRFTSGSVSEGPRLDLVTGEAGVEEDILSSSSLIPNLPPAQETRFSNLPSSLPGMNLNLLDTQGTRKPSSFDTANFADGIENTPIYLTSYLTTRKPPSYGTIVSIEEWDTVASTNQHVYIEGRGLSIGSHYVVFNDDEKVDHPTRTSSAGFIVTILGVVNILELVDERQNLYRARVTKAVAPVAVGSNIGEDDPSLRYNLSKTNQSGSFTSTVVSGYAGDDRVFVGMNEVLFLDMGEEHGVRTGDMIQIVENNRIGDNKKLKSKKVVGTAKVVKTTPRRATAIVLTTKDVIRPGDYAEPL